MHPGRMVIYMLNVEAKCQFAMVCASPSRSGPFATSRRGEAPPGGCLRMWPAQRPERWDYCQAWRSATQRGGRGGVRNVPDTNISTMSAMVFFPVGGVRKLIPTPLTDGVLGRRLRPRPHRSQSRRKHDPRQRCPQGHAELPSYRAATGCPPTGLGDQLSHLGDQVSGRSVRSS